jgi:hypothetical protein
MVNESQAITEQLPDSIEEITIKKHTRVYYGRLRVWNDEGYLLGRAHMNLLNRGKMVVNINVEIFNKGKFPFFKREDALTECTINIPIPMIKDLMKEIEKTGKRILHQKKHSWIKKRYKANVVVHA